MQLLPLEVFDERDQRAVPVARAQHDCVRAAPAQQLHRPQAALPGDELIAAAAGAAHQQRGEQAEAADGFRQLAQRFFVGRAAGLIGVGRDSVELNAGDAPLRGAGTNGKCGHERSSSSSLRRIYIRTGGKYPIPGIKNEHP